MTRPRRREPSRYPLVPKSNRHLSPGDFWAVPLWDGSYACGRVIELPLPGPPGDRVSFLGALLDWHGLLEPTGDEIAGAVTLAQGEMHINAIRGTGGAVLGNRPLSADGIEPWTFMTATYPMNASITSGLKPVRPARPDDYQKWPVLVSWGAAYIKVLAEERFLRRSTITGRTGAEELAERRRRTLGAR